MADYLILTVIGDDRPGLVEELATVISGQQGNWLEASLSHLAGKFAGIVKVAVPPSHEAALREALDAVVALRISAEASAVARSGETPGRRLSLSLVGHDRIGIVREVSQALARHAVNVEKLETRVGSAPMSAETLFYAEADLAAAPGLDVGALKADLERISNDLMVDITLGETLRG